MKKFLYRRRDNCRITGVGGCHQRRQVEREVNKTDFTTFSMVIAVIIAVQVHWLLAVVFFLGTYAFLAEA